MAGLSRPTRLFRFTVDQNGYVSVAGGEGQQGPVIGRDQGLRRVQVLTPGSPVIMASLDAPPTEAGPNRTGYRWAPLPPDAVVRFMLAPEQELYLVCDPSGGMATGAVICEYPAGEEG